MKITSLQNIRIKQAVKLQKRSYRDETGLMLIEGYRELKRALDNKHYPKTLFIARDYFLGDNEDCLIDGCRLAGADILECSNNVFQKMSYRDRPDGLLAIAQQIKWHLEDIKISSNELILVVESIEKPGNLGTMLRSADATGVSAVIVCDKNTDVNNPNVVRASLGALFTLPVVETSTNETINWLHKKKIQSIAASPEATNLYTEIDMTRASAIVVGSEQYGLESVWRNLADQKVKLPMLGQCDSLNVASAATVMLYEAVRQRMASTPSASQPYK